MTQAVQASSLIVIADVATLTPGKQLVLRPEAVLKGTVPNSDIEIPYPASENANCEFASFDGGTRVLVFLAGSDGHPSWPAKPQVFLLKGGAAIQQQDQGLGQQTEASMVSLVRRITGQYAVPAASNDEGASLDWVRVVLPTTIVVLVVFGIGLLLMRTWHRIDPT